MKSVSRLFTCLLVGLVSLFAFRATEGMAQDGKLETAGPRVKQHVEKILEKFPQGEQYGRTVGQHIEQAGKSEQYQTGSGSVEGPETHPWIPQGNPQSEQDYKQDSSKMVDESKLTELWSCLEPKLMGEYKPVPRCHPESLDLCLACYFDCVVGPEAIMPWLEHDYEVIEFWWPEHQIDVNNFGINRLKPQEQSDTGRKFIRNRLVQEKQESEREIKQKLEEKKAIRQALLKTNRKFKNTPGQGHWGGFSTSDLQEKDYAHGYRTRVSYRVSNDRPEGSKIGWKEEMKCIANALAPKTDEKDIINMWTEYKTMDPVWTMPEMTKELGQREEKYYKVAAPEPEDIQTVGKKDPPWFKNKGAAAFRLAKWQQTYGDLKDAGIEQGQIDEDSRTVFYFGGGQLAPFVGNLDGFFPPLSHAAYISRRGFYLMGVDNQKVVQMMPHKQKGRMNEYTIMDEDKSREIDKMQRVYPDGPSECFRSQRIPNIPEQTEDSWVKKNFPHDLVKDWKDQKGSVNYAYWNKRVACTCKYFSIAHTGCWQMDEIPDGLGRGRGTGDRPYGKFEKEICKYPEGLFPSAFFGDKMVCPGGGRNYKGLQDSM